MGVSQSWGQEGSRPDRRTSAQRTGGLGPDGRQHRIQALLPWWWSTPPEASGKTVPQRRRAPGAAMVAPVRDGLARPVSAWGHRNQTVAVVKPEQSRRTAPCLGLAGA